MEEEKKDYITGLVNTNFKYIIYAQTHGNKTFYKLPIQKKDFDGQTKKAYIPVRFAKCEPVQDGTIIKIKNAIEDWYINPKDTWNIIPVLVIFNYEILKVGNEETKQAIDEFNNISTDDDSLPF